MLAISATAIPGHSIELAAAAASDLGDKAVTDGAKMLALTGIFYQRAGAAASVTASAAPSVTAGSAGDAARKARPS